MEFPSLCFTLVIVIRIQPMGILSVYNNTPIWSGWRPEGLLLRNRWLTVYSGVSAKTQWILKKFLKLSNKLYISLYPYVYVICTAHTCIQYEEMRCLDVSNFIFLHILYCIQYGTSILTLFAKDTLVERNIIAFSKRAVFIFAWRTFCENVLMISR